MYVKVLHSVPPYAPGEVLNVSDQIGKQFIDRGLAEEFTPKKKPGPKPAENDEAAAAKKEAAKAKVAAKAREKRAEKKAAAKEEADRPGAVKEG